MDIVAGTRCRRQLVSVTTTDTYGLNHNSTVRFSYVALWAPLCRIQKRRGSLCCSTYWLSDRTRCPLARATTDGRLQASNASDATPLARHEATDLASSQYDAALRQSYSSGESRRRVDLVKRSQRPYVTWETNQINEATQSPPPNAGVTLKCLPMKNPPGRR